MHTDAELMSQQHTACEPCGGTTLYHCPGHPDVDWHIRAIDRAHENHGQWLNLARRHREAGRPNRAAFALQRAALRRRTIVGHRAALACPIPRYCTDPAHIHPFPMD